MIRLTLQRKVFLATFSLTALLALVLILVMRWNLGLGFERYTATAELARLDWLVENVEQMYARSGDWGGLNADPQGAWRILQQRTGIQPFPPPARRPPGRRGGGAPAPASGPEDPAHRDRGPGTPPDRIARDDPLGIGPRLSLIDHDGRHLAGSPVGSPAIALRPILYRGEIVGHLRLGASPAATSELDRAFLASQTRTMLIAAGAALLLSLLAAGLLTRHLLAPIHALTDGARQIAAGRLDTRIRVHRDDELGALADSFNAMAQQLAKLEASRRIWISESSHELRTPLAVLRAEIEALQDGVRQADAGTFERLHRQVHQLATLVDDLRLTLDQGPGDAPLDRAPLCPARLLHEVSDGFLERFQEAGIGLDRSGIRDAQAWIPADAGRLTQVFANLLENSLRYTDRGGRLVLRTRDDADRYVIEFEDSAPAPPPEALAHLFERFYRAEPSRNRKHGGSGLGLSICRALVAAHGGSIVATSSPLGGLLIRIHLPKESCA